MKHATAILAALSQNIKINNREELLQEAMNHIVANLLYLKGVKPTEDNLTLDYLHFKLGYDIKMFKAITLTNVAELYGFALKYYPMCKTQIGGVHHETYCINVYLDTETQDVIILRVQDSNDEDIFLEDETNLKRGDLFNKLADILDEGDLDYLINTMFQDMGRLIK